MLMRIRLLLVASLATAIAFGATPAFAYGTGGFTVGNVQLLSYGCFYHPYAINLNLGPETTEWSVEARVMAPNGSLFDSSYNYGTGSGAKTIAEEMFFCSSLDPAGTYTVTGVLETYEGASDYTPTAVSLAPTSFQVTPYSPPPPPPPTPPAPPAPAPVYSDVTGTVAKKTILDGVKFTFRSKAIPAGTVLDDPLKWVLKYDGRSKRITQGPSEVDTKTLRFDSGRHVVKVYRNGARVMTVTVRA